ncbi:MAG: aldo/keto reductase [Caldicoprobacterales bacterium]|jgi:aryl-alcohol dehydrogenase-like predicted oxidoreductase
MEYTQFGKTGALVSRIGFGGAAAGLKNYLAEYDPESEEARKSVYAALELAVEKGITYYDTAPGYGNGLSERIFGDVLSRVDPKKIFLATKCFPFDDGSLGLSDYDYVMYSVEGSLKRLRRDYIDLLQLHGNSYTEEARNRILGENGALQALEQLKKDGVIKYIGFTTEDNNAAVYDLINTQRFDAIQLCYNFIFQHPYEPSRPFGSLFEAEKRKMGIATMRTTTSGIFQKWMRMIRPDDTFDYTRALIQFVLSNKLVDVALVGMRTPDEVLQNIEIAEDKSGRIDLDFLHKRYV